jgi:hypothetical protein
MYDLYNETWSDLLNPQRTEEGGLSLIYTTQQGADLQGGFPPEVAIATLEFEGFNSSLVADLSHRCLCI